MKNTKKYTRCLQSALAAIIAVTSLTIVVAAESTDKSEDTNLTVVVPSRTPAATVAPASTSNTVYPYDVTLTDNGNQRYIVKSYEISGSQKPEDIPTASFEQDGYQYTLTDILKNNVANTITKEHTEVVTIETKTKDMEEILTELPLTMKHSENGYAGELELDIKTILVESKGTGYSSYPVTAKREYPHLSNNDVALIPKTITEKGVELFLDDVDWRAASTTNVDFDDIEDTYTAYATYSGTGSSSYSKGYLVTAEYKGDVYKAAVGKTTYSAHFTGTKILPTVLPFIEETASVPETAAPEKSDTAITNLIVENDPAETLPHVGTKLDEQQKPINLTPTFAILIAIIAAIGFVFVWLYLRSQKQIAQLQKQIINASKSDDTYNSDYTEYYPIETDEDDEVYEEIADIPETSDNSDVTYIAENDNDEYADNFDDADNDVIDVAEDVEQTVSDYNDYAYYPENENNEDDESTQTDENETRYEGNYVLSKRRFVEQSHINDFASESEVYDDE